MINNDNNNKSTTAADIPSPKSKINNNYNNISIVEEENKLDMRFIEKVKEIVRSEKDCLLVRLQGELNSSYYKSQLKFLMYKKFFQLRDTTSSEYLRLVSLTESELGKKSKERIAMITFFCNNLIL
jgi:hypothetical protein